MHYCWNSFQINNSIKTHGVNNNVNFVNAQQAKIVNLYKNTKGKLLRTNDPIWYNKTVFIILCFGL